MYNFCKHVFCHDTNRDPKFEAENGRKTSPFTIRSLARSIFTAVLTFQGIDDLVMHVTWHVGVIREGRAGWELVEFGLHGAYNFSQISTSGFQFST